MTKPRSVAATANDNSIPGSRLEDGAITNAKIEDGAITNAKIEDDAIDNSHVSPNAAIVSAKLEFTQAGSEAIERSVEDKLRDTVSVKDFGAVGDYNRDANTGTDDSAAFQAALDYCASNLKGLYIPDGQYRIDTKLIVPQATPGRSPVRAFRLIGNAVGNSAEQGSFNRTLSRPAIFYTGDDALFELEMVSFSFYGFSCEGVNFFQPMGHPNARTASCFKILKQPTNVYPRNWRVVDCNFSLWKNVYEAIYLGSSSADNESFVGPHSWTRVHVRLCDSFARFNKITHNRFFVTDSYLHAFTDSAFKFVNNASSYLYIKNTTIESSNPAVVDASDTALPYKIFLDGLALERCGDEAEDGGWGFHKPQISNTFPNRCEIHISNNGYAAFDMPAEIRLQRGAVIESAHQPVQVSGVGWTTNTPSRVIPVISDNPAYGQTDTYTVGCTSNQLMPRGGDLVRLRPEDYSWVNGAGEEGFTPLKAGIPSPLSESSIVTSGTSFSRHNQGGLISPGNGYFYLSGALKGVGLQRLDSQASARSVKIERAGSGTQDIVLNFLAFSSVFEGTPFGFTFLFRANNGDEIKEAFIRFRPNDLIWVSPVAFKFGNNVKLSAVAGAEIAQAQNQKTVSANSTLDLSGPVVSGKYFIKSEIFLSDGSYAAYYVSGEVSAATVPNRNIKEIAKVELSGISISTVTGGNNGKTINVRVSNSTAQDISARLITTFLG